MKGCQILDQLFLHRLADSDLFFIDLFYYFILRIHFYLTKP